MLRLSVVPLALAILEATSMQLPPCRVNIALDEDGLDVLPGIAKDVQSTVYGDVMRARDQVCDSSSMKKCLRTAFEME